MLGPALGDVPAVESVVVDEPGDPELELIEEVPLFFGGVGGPHDRHGRAAGLVQDGVGEEPVGGRVRHGPGHRVALRSMSGVGARGVDGGGTRTAVGLLVASSWATWAAIWVRHADRAAGSTGAGPRATSQPGWASIA